jgi:hypothetical protein
MQSPLSLKQADSASCTRRHARVNPIGREDHREESIIRLNGLGQEPMKWVGPEDKAVPAITMHGPTQHTKTKLIMVDQTT